MRKSVVLCLVIQAIFLLRPPVSVFSGQENKSQGPVLVVLWFDTEDYIVPRSDDAAKRLAEILTRLRIRATFKVVGEKARVLEQRGRRDVINALLKHEIGYHSNTHSQQPTIALYLQNSDWDDGEAEFLRRESQGVEDIARIFGVRPTCYGQPGNAWAPQAYPALKRLGINVYLDEANHVGIEDQPFYYCGMLNVFKMRSNLTRLELDEKESLSEAKERVKKIYERLRASGGGTISIYYHPTEFINSQFWDAANFAHGENPPRAKWRLPTVKTEAEIEKGFRDFEEYITYVKSLQNLTFATASDLMKYYADRSAVETLDASVLLTLARSLRKEISFRRTGQVYLSPSELFTLFNQALDLYAGEGKARGDYRIRGTLLGPAHPFAPSPVRRTQAPVPWDAFVRAARDVESYCRERGRIPSEVWIGADQVSPQDYLATVIPVVEEILSRKTHPESVPILTGRLSAEQYVAEDTPELWNWVIFPEGFHAPNIMRLARLQAWTLKPAILNLKDFARGSTDQSAVNEPR